MIQKAHQYRCYPNPKQQTQMNKTFGCVRKYWNIPVDCFNNFIDPKLSVREWECSECGAIHQRDHNAARNILIEGYRVLTGEQYPSNISESEGSGSVEYTDYKHGESVRLKDWKAMLPSQMQDSMKCLLNGVS